MDEKRSNEMRRQLDVLRQTFVSHKTRDIKWRVQQLKALLRMIEENTSEFNSALREDLGWSADAVAIQEIEIMIGEIKYALEHMHTWMQSKPLHTPVVLQPASMRLQPEPLGVVLVISPWNYPIHLAINPLICSIAAGNCVVIKPSEVSAATSSMLARLIPKYLDTTAFLVIEGGVPETTALLKEKFDHIVYTGNGKVARVVMTAAAQHLTPVTLELGGKNPAIIDKDTNLTIAAQRIVWAKYMNLGQTCLAPDYVIVHPDVEKKFIDACMQTIAKFYGPNPKTSKDYSRIVNVSHLQRINKLLADEGKFELVVGGESDEHGKYLSPTIVRNVKEDAKLMEDEIFGPILPILDTTLFPARDFADSVVKFCNNRPKPLGLYVFSANTTNQNKFTQLISFGGGCINDTIVHAVTPYAPFGGVGGSGTGSLHGKFGFDNMSHFKTILHNSTILDPPIRYPPFTSRKVWWLRFMMHIPNVNPFKYLFVFGAIAAVVFATGVQKKFTM